MAQSGFTPILLYSSSTIGQAPAAGNLTNSTLGSELAINITDGKLFYKDNSNAVQVIGWKTVPTTAGGTGLTSYSAGDLPYYATGTALSKLGIGAAGNYLSSSGTAPQWSAPAALTKTDDTNVTLTLGGNASTALLNAASLTLGWTGTLAVSRGGTGTGTAFTAGSVIFAGASGVYSQDNANFFWDDTNNRLGIGTTTVNADGIEISKLVGRATPVPVELRLTSSDDGTGWSTTLPWARLSFYDSDTSLGGPKLAASIETIMDATAGGYSSLYIKTQDTSGSPYALKTAVKIDGAQNVTVSNGNLVIGTSGKGIDFSVTSGGAGTDTSELFDDYEEGYVDVTATPQTSGTITLDSSVNRLLYTKIGRMVYVSGMLQPSAISSPVGDYVTISPLPFTVAASTKEETRSGNSMPWRPAGASNYSAAASGTVSASGTTLLVWTNANTWDDSPISQLYVNLSYVAA